VFAVSLHTPLTAAATQPIRIRIGLLGGGELYRRPPGRREPDRPRAGGRRDAALRADPLGRLPLPEEVRDRVLAPPLVRAGASLGRAEPLGARVAMISTVPTILLRAKEAGCVSSGSPGPLTQLPGQSGRLQV
jgi:hypothetical protein